MAEENKVEKVEEKPKPVETAAKSQAKVENKAAVNPTEKKEVKEIKKEDKKDEKKEAKKEEKGGKKEDKKKDGKADKGEKPKVEIVLERKYTVPFYEAYAKPAKKRGPKAMKMLRQFVSRHMKVPLENVRIDNRLSVFINARGIKHPPKKLNVKLQKDKEGFVIAMPA